jgi:hypothetical protein
MNIISVVSFITTNWGTLSRGLNLAVSAVKQQAERNVANSTKRSAAFALIRQALPAKIGDNWINLAIELALAVLRWRGVAL